MLGKLNEIPIAEKTKLKKFFLLEGNRLKIVFILFW